MKNQVKKKKNLKNQMPVKKKMMKMIIMIDDEKEDGKTEKEDGEEKDGENKKKKATCGHNRTEVTEVVLLGFGILHHVKDFIFVLFLLLYLASIVGNMMVITLIKTSPRLHSPMYFFLRNLSACEILFTTVLMPNMLYVIWGNGGTISLYGCITQLYLGASIGSAESLLLTMMAYDRYLAICFPLRYSSVMNNVTCNHLALLSWLCGFVMLSISIVSICSLQFCGTNTIDHLFCDFDPVLQISSSDISDIYFVKMEGMMITIPLTLFPFVLIILSYVSIFCAILRISSSGGRQRAFSTCSAHLVSVCTYFGAIFIIYLAPSERYSNRLSKMLSLLYTVGIPLLNPIIYSLRNQEMKESIRSRVFVIIKTKM
ncbi:olfactory receptor 10AG1-like [Hyperolius riggenbachi]|uniref:olfactory receptor 10AG1-like n=1 Tax=Hyperolius riggenbachi TaxID=752182 RepID=UPI0035A36F74